MYDISHHREATLNTPSGNWKIDFADEPRLIVVEDGVMVEADIHLDRTEKTVRIASTPDMSTYMERLHQALFAIESQSGGVPKMNDADSAKIIPLPPFMELVNRTGRI